MAKYKANENLIKGAGAAYTNYDNVPGMYEGIDKITKKGTEIMEGVVSEAQERKKIGEAVLNEYDKVSTKVISNNGGYEKKIDYDFRYDQVNQNRNDLIDALNSKDKKGIADAQTNLNKIINVSKEEVEYRRDLVDGDIGMFKEAMSIENVSIANDYLAENYTRKTENGKDFYIIQNEKYTKDDIDALISRKDDTRPLEFVKLVNKLTSSNYKELVVESAISKIVPEKQNELLSFMHSDISGDRSVLDLVEESKFKSTFVSEDMLGYVGQNEIKDSLNNPNAAVWNDKDNPLDWKETVTKIINETLNNLVTDQLTASPGDKNFQGIQGGLGATFNDNVKE